MVDGWMSCVFWDVDGLGVDVDCVFFEGYEVVVV